VSTTADRNILISFIVANTFTTNNTPLPDQ